MTGDLFGGPSPEDVKLEDQVRCVERELELRERVYPRWVVRGRMNRATMRRELLAMRAVLRTLRGLVAERGL